MRTDQVIADRIHGDRPRIEGARSAVELDLTTATGEVTIQDTAIHLDLESVLEIDGPEVTDFLCQSGGRQLIYRSNWPAWGIGFLVCHN